MLLMSYDRPLNAENYVKYVRVSTVGTVGGQWKSRRVRGVLDRLGLSHASWQKVTFFFFFGYKVHLEHLASV